VFEEIAALVQDRRYGKARQMVVLGLARSTDPRAVPLLVGLLGDEDVAAHAVMALGSSGLLGCARLLSNSWIIQRPWYAGRPKKPRRDRRPALGVCHRRLVTGRVSRLG
jgi:hypothetical protein